MRESDILGLSGECVEIDAACVQVRAHAGVNLEPYVDSRELVRGRAVETDSAKLTVRAAVGEQLACGVGVHVGIQHVRPLKHRASERGVRIV